MVECVKCGHRIGTRATACAQCTWPFSREGWTSTKQRIRRVTLDTGCVNAKGLDADLNMLEQWAARGHLELQRSDAMLKELRGKARIAKAKSLPPHPGLFNLGVTALGGPDVLAGPNLPKDLQQILFPTAHTLTDNQLYDVEHLRLHIRTGGDVFVTLNPNDFITRGRHETLRSFGIWILSPGELVGLLRELYGWQ